MPPIMHIQVPEHRGDVDIKAAYVPGLSHMAVKIGAGFFENDKLGLPNSPAMMVVLNAQTGVAEAILLDNAYLTDVRTGAAGAVVARHLAPSQIITAGVIGAGVQGRFQIRGLAAVRGFQRLLAFDLDAERLERYVADMRRILEVEVIAAVDAEQVVRESQFLVTCTPARRPYIKAAWLHPGLHITAMGADLPEKRELAAGVVGRADLIVCDRKSQSLTMGELHHAKDAGELDEEQVVELGQITSGDRPGRQSHEQITLCDLTGTGVQDTAIANLALQRALQAGLGMRI